MKRLPWRNVFFLVALTLAGVIGLQYCIGLPFGSLSYTNNIWIFLLWISLLGGLKKLVNGENWGQIQTFLLPGFLFSLCFLGAMAAGVQLDTVGAVDFTRWQAYASVVAVSFNAAPILGFLLVRLQTYSEELREDLPKLDRRKSFLITWGVLFLAYIPVFLASFPGFFTYDAEWTAYVVFTEKYSAHMPVVYVVVLGWMLRIVYSFTHSYNAGIALYIILQMAVLSACFAYMLSFLRSIGVRRWICYLGTAFLALSPTVSMFVCCSTKEGLFSGGIVLLTTLLLELTREGERFWQQRWKKICLAAACLLVLFYRKDGVYVLAVFSLYFAVRNRKTWKRWISCVLGIFVIFTVVTCGLKAVFHFTPGPVREMLCVPMQQLARVHKEDRGSFSKEDLETLYSLIPEVILEQYNPKLADNVKINFLEDNFKANPKKYIDLWVKTGFSHPDVYVNSFLMNTYGYWYPNTFPDGYRGIYTGDVKYGDSSYFAFSTEKPGVRRHLLPVLESFYEKISLEIYQQRLPVISMLFSIGFWHWIYLFAAMVLLAGGYRKQAGALLPMVLQYLIILLGPIVLVRYVLYLFFGVPLVLALLFDAKTVAGEGMGG